MDIVDHAQRLEETARDQALARVLAKVRDPDAVSADNCVECGFQIPSARQIAVPGTQHCAPCMDLIEKARRR